MKYFFIILALSNSIVMLAQNNKIDSLKKDLLSAKEDTQRIKTLNRLSEQYWRISDYGHSKKIADSVLVLCSKKLSDTPDPQTARTIKKAIGLAYNNIGIVFWRRGNYSESLKNYFESLKVRKEIGDKKGIASSYNNIGEVYRLQGNFTEALNNYFVSLRMKEKIGDKRGIANCYGNIANVYFQQGNYPDALKNNFSALQLYEAANDKQGISETHNNVGAIYYNRGEYAEALKQYFASQKIELEIGDVNGVASSYSNIGNIYRQQGNNRDAMKNYFASLKIREEIGDTEGIVVSYVCIGNTFNSMRNFPESRKYLDKALSLSKKIGSKYFTKYSYTGIEQLDSATGDFKGAYENYKLYITYRDSLNNEENTKKQTQIEMQYEFDKKQTADSISNAEYAKQEQLKHDQEIKQQRLYTYGGGIGFILMLIVAGVSFRAFKNKQKANEIISHQKELVEEKQKEILDSIHYAKRIQRSLLPTEKYIERNMKRLIKN